MDQVVDVGHGLEDALFDVLKNRSWRPFQLAFLLLSIPSLADPSHPDRVQPVEAYDLAIANLAPGLKRIPPPDSPLEALTLYPGGLTTREVAAIMSKGLEGPEPETVEQALLGLSGENRVSRVPLGNDALWIAATPA
jgi:hypothetical protein